MTPPRRICFVTGTRAEFGLMQTTLRAIAGHPRLRLQLVATGMHLDRRLGATAKQIAAEGWTVDALVPWKPGADAAATATATGRAMAGLAREFRRLETDVALVVGDRVEAFAAAAAAHLSHLPVAHVHGGDRALGLVDDSLRHAVSKLAHLHFPATQSSALRLRRMGEDAWRIHCVGSPGNDGLREAAAGWPELQNAFGLRRRRRFALLALHPAEADEAAEYERAGLVLEAIRSIGFEATVVIYPNNDPGSGGILRRWTEARRLPGCVFASNVARSLFLGLMRDAAVLAGNSSSGIIEAAAFGTPVLDIGPRQHGREASNNVRHVPYRGADIRQCLALVWRDGRPLRCRCRNVYGGAGAGKRIAELLARVPLDARLRRKLIAY